MVRDRPTRAHETIFLFSNRRRYDYYKPATEPDATIWTIPTTPARHGHPAPYPQALAEACIRRSTRHDEIVLDPFAGAGTTAAAARALNRRAVCLELSPAFATMAAGQFADLF